MMRVTREETALLKRLFDVDFYLSAYADVKAAKIDPLDHYLDFGWKELRNPSPDFSTGYYLKTYLDSDEEEINPLLHYVRVGAALGFRTMEDYELTEEMQKCRRYFDEKFYSAQYPAALTEGYEPFAHYMLVGWREGKDPSAQFSTAFFLRAHREVRESNMNLSLIHI